MPVYEFKCNDCCHVFSELRRIGDYNGVACPGCHSTNTEKLISLFSGGKSGKSCSSCKPRAGG